MSVLVSLTTLHYSRNNHPTTCLKTSNYFFPVLGFLSPCFVFITQFNMITGTVHIHVRKYIHANKTTSCCCGLLSLLFSSFYYLFYAYQLPAIPISVWYTLFYSHKILTGCYSFPLT